MTTKDSSAKIQALVGAPGLGKDMVFYILTPYKIEAHEYKLRDFLADDLLEVIQSAQTKIATDEECLAELQKAYPQYHKYKVILGKT